MGLTIEEMEMMVKGLQVTVNELIAKPTLQIEEAKEDKNVISKEALKAMSIKEYSEISDDIISGKITIKE